MDREYENKIVLIVRETRLDDLILRYNTLGQAQFYIEHLGADFSDYLVEDKIYKSSVSRARQILTRFGRVQVLHRRFVPDFIFGNKDLIVVLGQDGLVANTMKYLDNQYVIGVNPDPERWDGVLLPFQVSDLEQIVLEVFAGKRPISTITMAKASLSDGQSLCAVNDFFIGAQTHVSARYTISINNRTEDHSSSGIIVSTGLGSSGWLKSILTGAAGITSAAGIKSAVAQSSLSFDSDLKCDWDTDHLYFSVREPFPSKTTSTDLVFGEITRQEPMILLSKMPGNGVIFSDGVENDYLKFNSGMTAKITLSDKCGHFIV